MKKSLDLLPFLLLTILVPFFFYGETSIAQSIIVLSLCGLCGYRYYQEDKKKPDYVRLFQDEFNKTNNDLKQLKEAYGKAAMNDMKSRDKVGFTF